MDPALSTGLPSMIEDSMRRSILKGDERAFLRACEALRGMMRDNVGLAAAADREARLDYGLPTSTVGTYRLEFDSND